MSRTSFTVAGFAALALLAGAVGVSCSRKTKSADTSGTSSLGNNGTTTGDPTACESAGAATGKLCFGITGKTPDDSANLPSPGCAGFPAGPDRTACEQLASCLRGSACQAQIATAMTTFPRDYSLKHDPLPCLCGTAVDKSACLRGSNWGGVCQAQFVAAAGGAGVLLGRYTDTRFPVGVARNLMACDVQATCIPPGGIN